MDNVPFFSNNGKEMAEATGNGLLKAESTQANNLGQPGAGILHAGVCEGAVGQLAVLPRSQKVVIPWRAGIQVIHNQIKTW